MDILITEADRRELQLARHLLEHPGLAARITHVIGMPIEKGMERLPKNWSVQIGKITRAALLRASMAAIFTLKDAPGKASSDKWHKLGVAATGGISGFFGLTALAIELPVSTTIMLRSIAEIARSQGESISNPETKLACLEVLALGGSTQSDDATGSGYYAVRALLSKSISEAAEFVVERGLAEKGAPVLVRLIAVISQRFGIQITEKAAAQAIPAIGAAGGALINTIFMDHFQDMAKGHFIVRRLERKYGKEAIQDLYGK
ncbi:MAG TPA: EcsC family protein [Bacteroidales bacterium]|nr:EcsC family protein [Bacteroidales bacterium]